MKRFTPICAATALLLGGWTASALAKDDRPVAPASRILLHQILPDGEITMEQFGDDMVIVSERGTSMDTPYRRLDMAADAADTTLCAAQIFAHLSSEPIPDILFKNCPDREKAMAELEVLQADAKIFAIVDEPIESRPGFCNNLGNDAQQFKDIECAAALVDLFTSPAYTDDYAYWCANTLRSSSLRIKSEGDDSHSRTVSCHGNTRFRLYKRDGSGDPWVKYRDHLIRANEFEVTHVVVWETYSDSDTKFLIESAGGAWHRNTGYFVDD